MRAYALLPVPEFPENPAEPYCGSTACVAGWVSVLASPPGSYLYDGYYVRTPDGDSHSISNFGQEAAGLSYTQAEWLFDGARSREEVLAGLDALLENPEADVRHIGLKTMTVTVTDDEGNQLYTRQVKVERNADEFIVLRTAYYQV
jgi:hypothetical protein